jgi:hypothetical protein
VDPKESDHEGVVGQHASAGEQGYPERSCQRTRVALAKSSGHPFGCADETHSLCIPMNEGQEI